MVGKLCTVAQLNGCKVVFRIYDEPWYKEGDIVTVSPP